MERRLSEAAMKGDVESLAQILKEDPIILDTIIASCDIPATPLHSAAVLGHLDFVEHLLTRRPELAGEPDERGRTPLHLAAGRGHADVVREILLAGGEAAWSALDADGRTAVHVAAIKGRAEVLEEMARARPESIRALTDRGETGLHLCVKWGKAEAARVLGAEMARSDGGGGGEMVNWKDCEGNAALHIAVANKNIEIINYLLTLDGVQINALNKNGLTPLDVLTQTPRDLRDMDIEKTLLKSGASTATNLHLISDDYFPSKPRQKTMKKPSFPRTGPTKKPVDWLARKRSSLMVVASLIATVAFQAGLTPPGGVWQDDADGGLGSSRPHRAGQSVMAYREPRAYGMFMIFNTVAFLSSLSIILLLVSGLPLNRRRWVWAQMVTLWVAITAQAATYFLTLRHMSPRDAEHVLRKVTEISVLTWLTLVVVVFAWNTMRMNVWVLRRCGCLRKEETGLEELGVEVESD